MMDLCEHAAWSTAGSSTERDGTATNEPSPYYCYDDEALRMKLPLMWLYLGSIPYLSCTTAVRVVAAELSRVAGHHSCCRHTARRHLRISKRCKNKTLNVCENHYLLMIITQPKMFLRWIEWVDKKLMFREDTMKERSDVYEATLLTGKRATDRE